MKKDDIRRSIKTLKAGLSETGKRDAAQRVFNRLEQSTAFMRAENILLYHSLPDELSTHEFLAKWHSRKHFYLPRVNGESLEILPYDENRLSLGAFSIEEPTGNDIRSISDIDLIVIPAIAYDRQGNRVGRGKGYYDRLLATCHATKIGVGYDFQLIDRIDTDPHDVAVDIVITEHHYITVPRRKR